MTTEVGEWQIIAKVSEENFIPKFTAMTAEGSSLGGQEADTMGMQGISEALDWAFQQGRRVERDAQLIAAQGERIREMTEMENDLKSRLQKLAGDLQQLIQQNDAIKADASKQAVELVTEVETLKEKLRTLEAERNHPPMEAPKPA